MFRYFLKKAKKAGVKVVLVDLKYAKTKQNYNKTITA